MYETSLHHRPCVCLLAVKQEPNPKSAKTVAFIVHRLAFLLRKVLYCPFFHRLLSSISQEKVCLLAILPMLPAAKMIPFPAPLSLQLELKEKSRNRLPRMETPFLQFPPSPCCAVYGGMRRSPAECPREEGRED